MAAAGDGMPAILVVLNKVEATQSLIEAVRRRAAAGPARFHVLDPNPEHVAFDLNEPDPRAGAACLARAWPRRQGGGRLRGDGYVRERAVVRYRR